jgi:hypothetical protein
MFVNEEFRVVLLLNIYAVFQRENFLQNTSKRNWYNYDVFAWKRIDSVWIRGETQLEIFGVLRKKDSFI